MRAVKQGMPDKRICVQRRRQRSCLAEAALHLGQASGGPRGAPQPVSPCLFPQQKSHSPITTLPARKDSAAEMGLICHRVPKPLLDRCGRRMFAHLMGASMIKSKSLNLGISTSNSDGFPSREWAAMTRFGNWH